MRLHPAPFDESSLLLIGEGDSAPSAGLHARRGFLLALKAAAEKTWDCYKRKRSMTPRYYHTPSTPNSTRVRCPVCHEAVYSKAGIHPQCAVRQSEKPEPKGEGKGLPADPVPIPEIKVNSVLEEA